jgi:HSP20 family protein
MLTLTNYRPLRLSEMMDRLFDESFERPSAHFADYALPVNLQVRDEEYLLTAAVPGLKAEDLSVEINGDTVTLRGETFAPAPDEKAEWLLQERRYGKFTRTLTLPSELDSARAEASIENGVLSLRLPKAESAKPKVIKVKAR